MKQHVDALVRLKCIDRAIAAQRGIRIRDLDLCRRLIEAWLGSQEWWHAQTLGTPGRSAPCTIEQLPLVPPFEHHSGTI